MSESVRKGQVGLVDIAWIAVAALGFVTACSLIVSTDKNQLSFAVPADGSLPRDAASPNDGSEVDDGGADGSQDASSDAGGDAGPDGSMMCPGNCDDGNVCTSDSCDAGTNYTCHHAMYDSDNDTYRIEYQGNVTTNPLCVCIESPCNDCDDSNPNVHPGATELCDNVRNDCTNGTVDDNCLSDNCNVPKAIALTLVPSPAMGIPDTYEGTIEGNFQYFKSNYYPGPGCGVEIPVPNRRDAIFSFSVPATIASNGTIKFTQDPTSVDVIVSRTSSLSACLSAIQWATKPCLVTPNGSTIDFGTPQASNTPIYVMVKDNEVRAISDSRPFKVSIVVTPAP